eukprot:GHVR01136628.1.p1 GENE.GHVR01136628.1~~GHVR01136628.1.p1  ORF type:complete len:140 (+),score=33.67 GHVR01136628.1:136-555(+)
MFRLAFPLVVLVVNVRGKDKYLYNAIAGQLYKPITLIPNNNYNTFIINFNGDSVDEDSNSDSVYGINPSNSDTSSLQCVFNNDLHEIIIKYNKELSEYFTENVGCQNIDLQKYTHERRVYVSVCVCVCVCVCTFMYLCV